LRGQGPPNFLGRFLIADLFPRARNVSPALVWGGCWPGTGLFGQFSLENSGKFWRETKRWEGLGHPGPTIMNGPSYGAYRGRSPRLDWPTKFLPIPGIDDRYGSQSRGALPQRGAILKCFHRDAVFMAVMWGRGYLGAVRTNWAGPPLKRVENRGEQANRPGFCQGTVAVKTPNGVFRNKGARPPVSNLLDWVGGP